MDNLEKLATLRTQGEGKQSKNKTQIVSCFFPYDVFLQQKMN